MGCLVNSHIMVIWDFLTCERARWIRRVRVDGETNPAIICHNVLKVALIIYEAALRGECSPERLCFGGVSAGQQRRADGPVMQLKISRKQKVIPDARLFPASSLQ